MDTGGPEGLSDIAVFRPTLAEFRSFPRFVRWLQHNPEFQRVGLAKVSACSGLGSRLA